jgi:cytochrome c oxidase assembly factor 3
VGVWAYSISAVRQDVFDDVDEEVAVLSAGSKPTTPAAAGGSTIGKSVQSSSTASVPAVSAEGALAETASSRAGDSQHVIRGILPPLEKHLPGWFKLLDPERKTLVWRAPAVDNMGKLGDKS